MAGASQGGNSRVTNQDLLVRLDERMNAVNKRLDSHDDCLKDIDKKLDLITENQANVKNLQEDVNDLQRNSKVIDYVLGAATVIGTVIGAIFGQQRL